MDKKVFVLYVFCILSPTLPSPPIIESGISPALPSPPFGGRVLVQERVMPKYKTFYIPKKSTWRSPNALLIDSLKLLSDSLKSANEKLQYETILNDSLITLLSSSLDLKLETIAKSDSTANDLNKSLTTQQKTTRNLLITLIIASVLILVLLIALLFANRKRKKKIEVAPTQNVAQQKPITPEATPLDMRHKLEQLERLARMREKGILTEEEFAKKKQDVLLGRE